MSSPLLCFFDLTQKPNLKPERDPTVEPPQLAQQ